MRSAGHIWHKPITSPTALSQRDSYCNSPSTRVSGFNSVSLSPTHSDTSLNCFSSLKEVPRYSKAKLPKFKRISKRALNTRLKLSMDRFLESVEETNIKLEQSKQQIMAKLPGIRKIPSLVFEPNLKTYIRKRDPIPKRRNMDQVYKKIQRDLHRVATEVCLMG
mmetsp:Transcript_3395/g.7018  ORF Transcript_3395/g.7018 Transcript_3395/m.7018 type:complete len:164 (+) Transcript_3395:460-951(+)